MGAKILVVDDEPDLELLITQKYRKKIRDKELEFIFASNGIDALSKLNGTHDIVVVVTDINMPEMDGLTLLGKLNVEYPLMKSVIVSAYGDMANIRTALNRGAFDFLTKPIDFQDLDITLDKTVQQAQLHRRAVNDHDRLVAIGSELDIARNIQQAILPQHFPSFPGHKEFDLYANMTPARKVGGDFYDYFMLDDEHLGFAIGDVSGKGIPAAIFMAVSRTSLRAIAMRGLSPDSCLQEMNDLLQAENKTQMFVTVFYGILNIRTGLLRFSNAGHTSPYLLGKDGAVRQLEITGNFVIGALAGTNYSSKELHLRPGESIVLYTDGVTEAMNPIEEQFSEARLADCLTVCDQLSSREIVQNVIGTVTEFAKDGAQYDDITVLALKYVP